MNLVTWTSFCGRTGKSHDNLIQCPDCHVRNPQIPHSISSSTSVRRDVVDLSIDSSPPSSPPPPPPARTQAAVLVSAAPKFVNYNRERGAETLRQAHFSQRAPSVRAGRRQTSVTLNPTSFRTIVTFSLLQYELVDGLSQTVGYQVLGVYIRNPENYLLLTIK